MLLKSVDYLAIHCAATKPDQDIGFQEIHQWHLDKGWAGCGYHYIIRRDGEIEKGRSEEIAGAHVRGFNRNSIGICLIGGISDKGNPANNFTKEQWVSLKRLLKRLSEKYPLAKILGHRDFPGVKKACPSFDVRKELDLG
jgi:N-acetylmuramoyl-L-alanine amidase